MRREAAPNAGPPPPGGVDDPGGARPGRRRDARGSTGSQTGRRCLFGDGAGRPQRRNFAFSDHRSSLPPAGRGQSGGSANPARRGALRNRTDARPALASGGDAPSRAGSRLQLHRRRCSGGGTLGVRCGLLRHLGAGGRADGPAATPAAHDRLGGDRGCGADTGAAELRANRGLYRLFRDGPWPSGQCRAHAHRCRFHDREHPQPRREPAEPRLRPHRAEPYGGHRLLVFADRARSGGAGARRGGDRSRTRGRRACIAVARALRRLLPGGDALAQRPASAVRRGGGRLCPR